MAARLSKRVATVRKRLKPLIARSIRFRSLWISGSDSTGTSRFFYPESRPRLRPVRFGHARRPRRRPGRPTRPAQPAGGEDKRARYSPGFFINPAFARGEAVSEIGEDPLSLTALAMTGISRLPLLCVTQSYPLKHRNNVTIESAFFPGYLAVPCGRAGYTCFELLLTPRGSGLLPMLGAVFA